MPKYFDAPLKLEFDHHASRILGGEYYRLQKSFKFYLPASHVAPEWVEFQSNRWVFCAAGMLTDLGTAPKAFKNFVNNIPNAVQAYVMHDQLCEYLSVTANGQPERITRQEADLILKDGLLDLGVDKSLAHLIYNAVANYQMIRQIREPSTTRLKRDLEAAYNFEALT